MKKILALLILCGALLLVAGCTNQPVTPTETPALSATPTAEPTTRPDLKPEPTDVVPSTQHVAIQVTKNTVATNPWVSVLFAGGSGQSYVTEINATIIRFDGI
ncbi:MAG: hypothetical protein HGA55_03920, partial [Methanoregulaceae archaeon]|nr:hypothetical protein [Methanoregulaceae archaeon]